MSSGLRTSLGKSQIETKKQLGGAEPSKNEEWPYDSWAEAVDAFDNGDKLPDPRFAVILDVQGNDTGSLPSAELLQELANCTTLPPVSMATMTDRHGSISDEKVHVTDISWDEVKLLKKRTTFEEVFVWVSNTENQQPRPKVAVRITSVSGDWKRRPWVPWAPSLWSRVMTAHFEKSSPHFARFPIIIEGAVNDGPIASPEALKKLLGLPRVPLLSTTRMTRIAGDWSGEEVKVADVDAGGRLLLDKLAKFEKHYIWFPDASLRKILTRAAYVVKSIRETPLPDKVEKWKFWGEAVAAFSRGEFLPEIRLPIIMSMPGTEIPITAKGLQILAGLTSVPELSKTTITRSYYGFDGVEVLIADANREQINLLRERTEVNDEEYYVWYPSRENGELTVLRALMVTKVKDRWLESLEWEESLEQNESQDHGSGTSSECG